MHIGDNIFVIKTEPKTFQFDLPKGLGINLRHNELLAEHSTKMRLVNYFPNIKMETIFMYTENSRTTESHKFVFSLPQRLDLRSSNKDVASQSLCIYYSWKNKRQQYNTNKLKIIAPTWNDEFDYQMVRIQSQVLNIISSTS